MTSPPRWSCSAALEWVREDMQELSAKAKQLRKEERALFDVYLMMLEDAALGGEVRAIIKTGQAQGALRQVVNAHVARFELMDDAYLRGSAPGCSATPGRRLLAYSRKSAQAAADLPGEHHSGGASRNWSPAMLGEVPSGQAGRPGVSVQGSATPTWPSWPAPWVFPR